MTESTRSSPKALALRLQAEAELARRRQWEADLSAQDPRLYHVLQVHQIELEMQNAELEQAREEVAKLLESYTDLYEFAPVGYLTLDAKGTVLQANLTAVRLLGTERSALLGQPFLRFLAEHAQAAFQAFLSAWFSLPQAATLDLATLDMPGRAPWIRLETSGGASPECRVAFLDITERKRAEEHLRRLEADLVHTQKMESLGCLAAGVAHDINNVLGAIRAATEALLLDASLVSNHKEVIELVLRATDRGRRLLGGLMAFARKDLLEPEEVDLNGLVVEEVDLLQRSTLQKVAFRLELAESGPKVWGERARLSAALMNLCTNAIDAMPKGGTLTLRTLCPTPDWVILEVEDSGEGMPPEVLARAMDPFFTTKPQGQGTGLGLTNTYATVHAHGGTFRLESTQGWGTRAQLRFPTLPSCVSAFEALAAVPAHGAPLAILLVDDDELIRTSVSLLLEALGHRPTCAAGGAEALDLLDQDPAYDLVILDQNMPGMKGHETLARLRQRWPTLPAILATGNPEAPPMHGLEPDAQLRILAKPFTVQELREAIRLTVES